MAWQQSAHGDWQQSAKSGPSDSFRFRPKADGRIAQIQIEQAGRSPNLSTNLTR